MSLQDSLFIEEVENDVTFFFEDARRKRVLVFPPVNNYRRFLIHQFVQDQFGELLHTFSIGQASARRTVVCFKSDLIRHPELNGALSSEKSGVKSSSSNMGVERPCSPSASPENSRQRQVKTMPAVEIYRPPAARKVKNTTPITSTLPESSAPKSKQRRPDRAVYVPKHRRSVEAEGSPLPQDDCSSGKCKNDQRRKLSLVDCRRSMEPFEMSIHNKSDEIEAPKDNSKEDDAIYEFASNQNGISSMEIVEDASGDFVEVCLMRNIESSLKNNVETRNSMLVNGSGELNNGHSTSQGCSELIETSAVCSVEEKPLQDTTEVKLKDEAVERNNAKTQSQNLVSDVLIISRNDERPQENISENDSSTVTVRPPEKKPKKVARTKSKPAPPPSLSVKLNRDECDWDSLFDDNGECLDPTLIDELTAAVGEVTIEQPKSEYKAFSRHVEVSSDEFGHVIEIYNFPSDFKTSDLAAVFTPWKNGGFELKWVDDTHCLGVFSSPVVAAEVLASDHPFVKTRPMSEATALSRTKARKSAEFLQPYKSRPETCAALARRLVTGALGVKLATARQEREHEKVLLREAKERRRLANKQREDAWEGVIAHK